LNSQPSVAANWLVIKRVIPRVVPHRLQVKAEAELEGTSGRIIADDIQRTLKVPI